MAEFTLDTSGAVNIVHEGPAGSWGFDMLDPFTQGYVEALFASLLVPGPDGPEPLLHPAFSDLAPETLAAILKDCERLKPPRSLFQNTEAEGGKFWADRQSSFTSYWGPARVPMREQFPPLTPYLGDDGRVYLRDSA